MKNLKAKMTVLAVVLGLTGAFATVSPHLNDRKWSLDPVTHTYMDITGQQQGVDYSCTASSSVCTATYPQGQNPNQNASNPISVEQGLFN